MKNLVTVQRALFTTILLSLALFFIYIPAHAAEEATCFTSASGVLAGQSPFSSKDCSPQDLVAFMNALMTFFYRLAIVLSVLMITVGGMQWLMAIGNSERISNAKGTIQQAVLGLILALTAILLFNQIDSSFTNLNLDTLQRLNPSAATCQSFQGKPAECRANATTLGCEWRCFDVSERKKPEWTPSDGTWTDKFRDPNCAGTCEGGGDGKTENGTCSNAKVADCQNYIGCYVDDGRCLSSPNSCMKTAAEYQTFKNMYPTLSPECCSVTSSSGAQYAWANFVFNKGNTCADVCGGSPLSSWKKSDKNNCINNIK